MPTPWSSASSRPQIFPRQAVRQAEGPGAGMPGCVTWFPGLQLAPRTRMDIVTGALRIHGKLFSAPLSPCPSLSSGYTPLYFFSPRRRIFPQSSWSLAGESSLHQPSPEHATPFATPATIPGSGGLSSSTLASVSGLGALSLLRGL